jgi:hypothetical protein
VVSDDDDDVWFSLGAIGYSSEKRDEIQKAEHGLFCIHWIDSAQGMF